MSSVYGWYIRWNIGHCNGSRFCFCKLAWCTGGISGDYS
jgi:hypothetical protein